VTVYHNLNNYLSHNPFPRLNYLSHNQQGDVEMDEEDDVEMDAEDE
jgi:hypothetical protein